MDHRPLAAERFKVSGFGQPRNPPEYTAEELAEVRSTVKLAATVIHHSILSTRSASSGPTGPRLRTSTTS